MTIKELIELLQAQRPTKKVYISLSSACVELKPENITDLPWGLIIR